MHRVVSPGACAGLAKGAAAACCCCFGDPMLPVGCAEPGMLPAARACAPVRLTYTLTGVQMGHCTSCRTAAPCSARVYGTMSNHCKHRRTASNLSVMCLQSRPRACCPHVQAVPQHTKLLLLLHLLHLQHLIGLLWRSYQEHNAQRCPTWQCSIWYSRSLL